MSIQKVKSTLQDMLTDRGYVITDNSVEDKMIAKNIYGEEIMVLISMVEKLNINIIKDYIKLIEQLNIPKCIIVYRDQITSSARKVIQNLLHINIEVFTFDELQYNLTLHQYVRPHIKIKDEELKTISEKYGKNLPILLSTDPVSRYYNLKRGDIIKIIRKGDLIAYRMVK